MSGKVIPLSYVLRQQQVNSSLSAAMARCWMTIFDKYAGSGYYETHADKGNPKDNNRGTDPQWSKTNMAVWVNAGSERPILLFKIAYKYNGVLNDQSGFSRGTEKILSSADFEQPGKAWLIDLSQSEEPLNFQRQESVTISQSSETTMDHTTQIDVGTEAEQKATIGGAETGGSLEAGIKESFNYSDTKEETKTEARSEDKSEGTTIDEDCPEYQVTLITINSDEIHSDTPRGWHGAVDYGVTVDAPIEGILSEPANYSAGPNFERMRHGSRYHEYTATVPELSLSDQKTGRWGRWSWPNWDAFLSFLDGTDTAMPQMLDRHPSSARTIAILHDPAQRRIDLDGIEHRDYEEGARVKVAQVDAGDLSAVVQKHGITPDRIITKGQ